MFVLELDDDQKIILFELLNNLEEDDSLDQAEKRVVWDLIAAMESKLVEPFSADYSEMLERAKNHVLGK